MKNYLVKVKEATTSGGDPTATAEERSIGQAIGDSLTSMVKDNEASVGYVSTLVNLGLVYGGALYAKYRQVGTFSFNPL